MKIIIQIPCYNEENSIEETIRSLSKCLEDVSETYTLIIDDGSTDETYERSKKFGIDYILRNQKNIGLAQSFSRGIEVCLSLGAEIIINVDGDNQYPADEIPNLIEPIIRNKADMVIGCRDIDNHPDFSKSKKIIQKIGSAIVRYLSHTSIPDTTSGFRAINRNAAMKFMVMNNFSYTLETLIQAGRTGLRVEWISIRANPKKRSSRLYKSNAQFICKQFQAIILIFIFYCPLRFFGWLAIISFLIALGAGMRIAYYLWFMTAEDQKYKIGTGNVFQFSLLSTILFIISGLLGSVLSGLRSYLQDIRYRIRKYDFDEKPNLKEYDLYISPKMFQWKQMK